MLDLLAKQAFMPAFDLLVLNDYAAVAFQRADDLVCFVFSSV